jgi:2-keto-3-deoxy-6-phosphogluconate aldolase
VFPAALAAGLGVTAIGLFTVLDLQAWSDFRSMRDDPCAASRMCDTGGVRTKLVVADIALGVGIVSLGVAAFLALPHLGGRGARSALAR